MRIVSRTEVWEHYQTVSTKRNHVPKHARTGIPEQNSKHSNWRGPMDSELQICAWKGWGGQLEDRSVLMFSSQKTNKKKGWKRSPRSEHSIRLVSATRVPTGEGSLWAPVKGYTTSKPVFKGFANPSETFLSLSGSVIPRPPKTQRHHQEDYTLNSEWAFLLFLRQCRTRNSPSWPWTH